MRAVDELHLEYPFLGARQLRKILAREGHSHAGRLHISTLMAKMGITAPYRKPNTSKRHPGQARDWLLARYWHRAGNHRRIFATPEGVQLRTYRQTSILKG